MKSKVSVSSYRAAVKVIDAQRRILAEAKSDEDLIRAYENIVRYLMRMPDSQIERMLGIRRPLDDSRLRLEHAAADAAKMSLDDVDRALEDERTSRFDLEAIAIGRFQVPRGSMRSLGNITHLREKIANFVQNERAHFTIGEVARDYKNAQGG